MAVMHLSTKFGEKNYISIESEDIDILGDSMWRPSPSWIFIIREFGTFRHDGCLFLQLFAKFSSNISYTRRERLAFVPGTQYPWSCSVGWCLAED